MINTPYKLKVPANTNTQKTVSLPHREVLNFSVIAEDFELHHEL